MSNTQRVGLLLKPVLGTLLPINDFQDWPVLTGADLPRDAHPPMVG
ncbi:hypothetical protein [Salinibacterium xinjiangense]|nr:hypothetical protein [Salinibacterium xinjiangense]